MVLINTRLKKNSVCAFEHPRICFVFLWPTQIPAKFQDLDRSVYKTAYGDKPGEAIVAAAVEHKADMIVMGTRGMGTIRRTIMGSVSDYVVHHAPCPVIVCRQ